MGFLGIPGLGIPRNISWVFMCCDTQSVCTGRLPKTESGREDLTSLVTGNRDQTPPKVILKLWPCLDASQSHPESVTAVTANQHRELTSKSENLWVQHSHKSMANHPEISSGLCGWKPIVPGSSWEPLMRMKGGFGVQEPLWTPFLSRTIPGGS